MYQNLKHLVDPESQEENPDSVHYLMLPQSRCVAVQTGTEILCLRFLLCVFQGSWHCNKQV